jgi:ferrous iron transport protein A
MHEQQPSKHGTSPTARNLAMLHKGDSAVITGLMQADNDDALAIQMRLLELGFAPGEAIRVVAESFPGHDPMAVRIGNTTFALRRHEAAMIRIAQDNLIAAA